MGRDKRVNLSAGGRYFQVLPPKKQRDAERLEKRYEDIQRIFQLKGETK